MPVAVSSVQVVPFSGAHLRLRWIGWRLSCLNRRRNPLQLRLEANRLDRIALDEQCSLENPNKHDDLVKLRNERNEINRELEPLDQKFATMCRAQARHLTATHN